MNNIAAIDQTTGRANGINVPVSLPVLPGTTTLTNMPAADTELPAANYRLLLDLSRYSEFRITTRVATAGAANSDLRFQYATTDNGTFANLGANTVEIALGSTGEKDTGWVSLAQGARDDNIRLRLMGKEGDGAADPVVRQLMIHFR